MPCRSGFGLKGLIYQDTNNERAFRILAVVRAESGIKQLADLKKKSACFPEFGGLGECTSDLAAAASVTSSST